MKSSIAVIPRSLIFALAFILLLNLTEAQSINTTHYCSDNSTLFTTTAMIIKIGNKPAQTIIANESIFCPYNCDFATNRCIPEPSVRWLVVIVIVAVIAIIGFFVARRLQWF